MSRRYLTRVVVSLALASLAPAQAVHVVGPPGVGGFTSIQAAINAASSNDTIEVHPGTYLETIDYQGKDVAVVAVGPGGPAAHVIDAQGSGAVVRIDALAGPGAVLDGFTVTGGVGHPAGGIVISLAAPRILNCVITANQGGDWPGGSWPQDPQARPGGAGGVIAYRSWGAVIEGCEISGNTGGVGGSTSMYSGVGGAGGVTCLSSSVNMTNCLISGNSGGQSGTAVPGGAGGVHMYHTIGPGGSGALDLTDCAFAGNTAAAGGVGSALVGLNIMYTPVANVRSCTFSGHGGEAAVFFAGSLTLSRSSFRDNAADRTLRTMISGPVLTDCEFIDNVTTSAELALGWGSTVAHCTIVGSTSPVFDADMPPGPCGTTLPVTNCVIWNHVALATPWGCPPVVSSSCVEGGAPGTGNISLDPLFADPANGDYRLGPASPCIDAGDPAAAAGSHDLEGDPRVFYAGPDMGADEYVASCFRGHGAGAGLLTVDGSASPLVTVAQGQAATIALEQPASYPGAAPFVIWGMVGAPALQQAGVMSPFGDLCFVPYHLAPTQPGLFTLANSFFLDPSAIAPAVPGPWSLAVPTGGAAGVTLTLQGLVQDQLGSYATTNAIVVAVQ